MIFSQVRLFLLMCCTLSMWGASCETAYAKGIAVTGAQLTALMPEEQDLQGFVRVRPTGELLPKPVHRNGKWVLQASEAVPIPDEISLNVEQKNPRGASSGMACRIGRGMYSSDGMYFLSIEVFLCDSSETAETALNSYKFSSSGVFKAGTFFGKNNIGDESWILRGGGTSSNVLIFRAGRLMGVITGSQSRLSTPRGPTMRFPSAAIEAVANTVLLRAARQPDLTGIFAQTARLTVNGSPLSGNSLTVGKQVYVPAMEFAKAMGLQSQWDEKTGTLTLSGPNQQPITVTATSTDARVGQKSVSLKTPVLKEANQPVMALDDLLTLVKGKVISREGNAVEVKA